jgi:hypothetical protein
MEIHDTQTFFSNACVSILSKLPDVSKERYLKEWVIRIKKNILKHFKMLLTIYNTIFLLKFFFEYFFEYFFLEFFF